ncbi:MAG: glycosyltransferase family A protein [Candidatus Riflemargulisbacteria bacterium]
MSSQTNLVSIITPTGNREQFLKLQYENILNQTYTNWEWLILGDSVHISPFFFSLEDSRVKYHVTDKSLAIGSKRNWLIERATGTIIASFDDDDYYSPNYLEVMINELAQGYQFVKLTSFYIHSLSLKKSAYWDLTLKNGYFHILDRDKEECVKWDSFDENNSNEYGWGFSYVYFRSVFALGKYADHQYVDDYPFIEAALNAGIKVRFLQDTKGLMVHILHSHNCSRCFPQYIIPEFMLKEKIPGIAKYLELPACI